MEIFIALFLFLLKEESVLVLLKADFSIKRSLEKVSFGHSTFSLLKTY